MVSWSNWWFLFVTVIQYFGKSTQAMFLWWGLKILSKSEDSWSILIFQTWRRQWSRKVAWPAWCVQSWLVIWTCWRSWWSTGQILTVGPVVSQIWAIMTRKHCWWLPSKVIRTLANSRGHMKILVVYQLLRTFETPKIHTMWVWDFKMEHCEAPPSMTLLQLTWSGLRPGQDPSVLSTLMSLRADPDLVARSGIGAMWLALDPGQVQVLLEHKAILEHSALMLS